MIKEMAKKTHEVIVRIVTTPETQNAAKSILENVFIFY